MNRRLFIGTLVGAGVAWAMPAKEPILEASDRLACTIKSTPLDLASLARYNYYLSAALMLSHFNLFAPSDQTLRVLRYLIQQKNSAADEWPSKFTLVAVERP